MSKKKKKNKDNQPAPETHSDELQPHRIGWGLPPLPLSTLFPSTLPPGAPGAGMSLMDMIMGGGTTGEPPFRGPADCVKELYEARKTMPSEHVSYLSDRRNGVMGDGFTGIVISVSGATFEPYPVAIYLTGNLQGQVRSGGLPCSIEQAKQIVNQLSHAIGVAEESSVRHTSY